jgi:hypothetical protein
VDEWVGEWMGGYKSGFMDCLKKSKIAFSCSEEIFFEYKNFLA